MKCVTCKCEVLGFRDWLSYQEWQISGMCQSCQDSVFESDQDSHVNTRLDCGQ